MKHVEGKVAFITGGASGIGFGIAQVFLKAGMKVIISDILQERLDEAARSLAQSTNRDYHFIRVDVTDRKAMAAWYRTNLGIQSKGGYADFTWRDKDHPEEMGHTAWAIFPTNTTYFGQSSSSLMINYRVANLDRMLKQLRRSGVKIEKIEDSDYGRFAWIMDPEGNRIELWEPKGK